MSEQILYAAYGPNSDPAMLMAITGEPARMLGEIAILDVALGVHRMEDASKVQAKPWLPSPHSVLEPNWPQGESYTAVKSYADKVHGVLVMVTEFANELIKNWELVTLKWKEQREVRVQFLSDNAITTAVTEFLCPGQPVYKRVPGKNYPLYLNSALRMHTVARRVRQEYLKDHPRPY